MSGKILLFGFDSLPDILAIEGAVKPFEVELVPVSRTDYNKPIAVLAGLDEEAGTAGSYMGGTLGERMMVLCGLEAQLDALLSALAKVGIGPECLKAVMTVHNRKWNAVTLHTELRRERQAMEKR